MRPWFLFWLAFLLVSCSVPEISSPAPTPEAIFVAYPPVLQPWADKIADCASGNSLIATYFQPQSNPPVSNPSSDDIVLQLGDPSKGLNDDTLSQVGIEHIVIIVNKENTSTRFSREEISAYFAGIFTEWKNHPGQKVMVWSFPNADPVRVLFDRTFVASGSFASDAMLAPNPAAMLEAISSDPLAIGYLPDSFLSSSYSEQTNNIKTVEVSNLHENELSLPVIAVTQGDPTGQIRNLIVCLQTQAP